MKHKSREKYLLGKITQLVTRLQQNMLSWSRTCSVSQPQHLEHNNSEAQSVSSPRHSRNQTSTHNLIKLIENYFPLTMTQWWQLHFALLQKLWQMEREDHFFLRELRMKLSSDNPRKILNNSFVNFISNSEMQVVDIYPLHVKDSDCNCNDQYLLVYTLESGHCQTQSDLVSPWHGRRPVSWHSDWSQTPWLHWPWHWS